MNSRFEEAKLSLNHPLGNVFHIVTVLAKNLFECNLLFTYESQKELGMICPRKHSSGGSLAVKVWADETKEYNSLGNLTV